MKKTEKSQVKNLTKVLAFILAFFVLLGSFSAMLSSNKDLIKYSARMRDAYAFTRDKKDTIEIAAIGNSNLYSGFSPLDLWENYGYTSVVSASPAQSLQESEDMLKKIFDCQKPKLVIVESNMFYGKIKDKKDKTDIFKYKNYLADFFDSADPGAFEYNVEKVFPLFKYHNFWKGKGKDVSYMPNTHGYKYNEKHKMVRRKSRMDVSQDSEDISKYNIQRLDRILSLCKENNAQLLIVAMPCYASWSSQRHSGVESYAKSRNVPFLDLNLDYHSVGISKEESFRDNGEHLNYSGARAATKYIGEYIKKNYSIEKLSGKREYASWDSDVKAFEEYRQSEQNSVNSDKKSKNA